MSPEELAAKWYAKQVEIDTMAERIQALESEHDDKKTELEVLTADLVEHFAVEGASTKTHRVFLAANNGSPATIVEVLTNCPAARVESNKVDIVGAHIEPEVTT